MPASWSLQHVTEIAELGKLTVYELLHLKTKARLIYCHRNDPVSSFSLSFRTPVSDSRGTPHILEHLTLCGSKAFPVRDPFFKMLDRSLAAYMNAWTSQSWTCYPFVAEHAKDYLSLMEVYWDACFRPLLRREDFRQEGWRIEDDEIKGVVYNEMKGAMSDPDTILGQHQQSLMWHGSSQRHCSGGDPLEIPKLQYEDLVSFHQRHYNPSNCLIIAYGDKEPNWSFLDSKLSECKSDESALEFSSAQLTRFNAPVSMKVIGPPDPLGGSFEESVRYLKSYSTGSTLDLQRNFVLSILSHLLLKGASSPIHQNLIESGLANALLPHNGYDDHNPHGCFSIGVQGPKKIEAVDQAIRVVVERVKEEGFEEDRIEAVLESLELSLRHQPAMMGLSLTQRLTNAWSKTEIDSSPLAEALQLKNRIKTFSLESPIEKLKKLCQEVLIDNKHVLSLTQIPNPEYFDRRKEKEKELSANLENEIESKGAGLVEENDSTILPILSRSDISPEIKDPSIKEANGFQRVTPLTNGVTYLHMLFVLPENTPLHLIPVFCAAMTELGAGELSAGQLAEAIKRDTAGISFSPLITPQGHVFIQGSSFSLSTKVQRMKELFSLVVQRTHWNDSERISQVIKQLQADLMSALADAGSSYTVRRAASKFGAQHALPEQTSGLTFLERLNELEQAPSLNFEMKLLRSCVITDKKDLQLSFDFSLSEKVIPFNITEITDVEHSKLPLDTNFVAAVRKLELEDPKQIAAMLLLANVLRSKSFHPLIREQGGAYGAEVSFNPLTGLFSMSSYRDPSPDRTLDYFTIISFDAFDEKVLHEALLRHFSKADAPREIGDQGLSEFLFGMRDEKRAAIRTALLGCTVDDLREALVQLQKAPLKTHTIRGT